jgi:hypothetical protein
MDEPGLRLGEALQPREWAALRVLAAAVTLREIRVSRVNSTPAAWMAAHDELQHATDAFVCSMGGDEPCKPT